MVNGYKPLTLDEALKIRAEHKVIPYAGGTDVMVRCPEDAVFLFLNGIEALRQIRDDGTYIRIGAGVTFTRALDSELIPPLMKEAVSRIAAPAIRNAGTFGGNLSNASDKADSVLVEFALDAKLRLVSVHGERIIPVEDFSVRRGVTTLKDDELIAEVLLPKAACGYDWYYTKIGGRNALAISRVAFAGTYHVKDGVIRALSAAVIGGGAMFQRCRDIESTIVGMTRAELKAHTDDILAAYADKMVFSRGRVSAEYRRTVVMNLLRDFFEQIYSA